MSDSWFCPRCLGRGHVGYGLWPGSGPVKWQCVECGYVTDNPERGECR